MTYNEELMLFLRNTYHQALRASKLAVKEAARLEQLLDEEKNEAVEERYWDAMDIASDQKTVAHQAGRFYNLMLRDAKTLVYEDDAHPLIPKDMR